MILTFGSINADIVVPVPKLPQPGETVLGGSYELLPGGKGANQALAARRAGADVMLVGAVGCDGFAAIALASLRGEGVDTHLVRDIDHDLLKNLLDMEFKTMAQQFGTLVRTIIETVNRRGLKVRYLHKHKRSTDRFLNSVATTDFSSPLATKYKKRFQKSGEKMFTFLENDGVPWNNNNA